MASEGLSLSSQRGGRLDTTREATTTFSDLPPNAIAHIARCLSARYEVPCARKWRSRGVWSPVHAFAAASKACFAAVASGMAEVVLTSGNSLQTVQQHSRLQELLKQAAKLSIHADAGASLAEEQWEELAGIVAHAQPRFTALYVSSASRTAVPAGALARLVQASPCAPACCALPRRAARLSTGACQPHLQRSSVLLHHHHQLHLSPGCCAMLRATLKNRSCLRAQHRKPQCAGACKTCPSPGLRS